MPAITRITRLLKCKIAAQLWRAVFLSRDEVVWRFVIRQRNSPGLTNSARIATFTTVKNIASRSRIADDKGPYDV
jgi:hypothetical protein